MNTKCAADETPQRRRLTKLLRAAGILGVLVTLVWWPGCRQYPMATSRDNLDLIKVVYTACNTRSPKRVEAARRRIEVAARARGLSPAEEEGFRKILGLADAGDWRAAEAAALRFARDQVNE